MPAANPFLSWRDPTLSPYDQVRLEREKKIREQEIKDNGNRPHAQARVKKNVPDFKRRIDLQGIVSMPPGSNRAIVNGKAVGEGDMIGPVKVLRITPQEVLFGYKGGQFTKTVNR